RVLATPRARPDYLVGDGGAPGGHVARAVPGVGVQPHHLGRHGVEQPERQLGELVAGEQQLAQVRLLVQQPVGQRAQLVVAQVELLQREQRVERVHRHVPDVALPQHQPLQLGDLRAGAGRVELRAEASYGRLGTTPRRVRSRRRGMPRSRSRCSAVVVTSVAARRRSARSPRNMPACSCSAVPDPPSVSVSVEFITWPVREAVSESAGMPESQVDEVGVVQPQHQEFLQPLERVERVDAPELRELGEGHDLGRLEEHQLRRVLAAGCQSVRPSEGAVSKPSKQLSDWSQ
ncbi:Variable small protein 8, partial [Frankliniella fusca]